MNILKNSLVSIFLVMCAFLHLGAQDNIQKQGIKFSDIYTDALDAYGIHPLLKNGVYYENFFFNSDGHPFFLTEEYQAGSVTYRGIGYDDVQLRYDIFSQQLLILHDLGDEIFQNYLDRKFVSEFSLAGLLFRKLPGTGESPSFYQVVAEQDEMLLCRQWFKSRSENHEGSYMNYVFGEKKSRSFLVINDAFLRYRNNRSFIRALPPEVRSLTRNYLRSNKIRVNRTDDARMKEVLRFIGESLDQSRI